MRANAEKKSPLGVFTELVEENLDCAWKTEKLATSQAGLTELCHSFLMVRRPPPRAWTYLLSASLLSVIGLVY